MNEFSFWKSAEKSQRNKFDVILDFIIIIASSISNPTREKRQQLFCLGSPFVFIVFLSLLLSHVNWHAYFPSCPLQIRPRIRLQVHFQFYFRHFVFLLLFFLTVSDSIAVVSLLCPAKIVFFDFSFQFLLCVVVFQVFTKLLLLSGHVCSESRLLRSPSVCFRFLCSWMERLFFSLVHSFAFSSLCMFSFHLSFFLSLPLSLSLSPRLLVHSCLLSFPPSQVATDTHNAFGQVPTSVCWISFPFWFPPFATLLEAIFLLLVFLNFWSQIWFLANLLFFILFTWFTQLVLCLVCQSDGGVSLFIAASPPPLPLFFLMPVSNFCRNIPHVTFRLPLILLPDCRLIWLNTAFCPPSAVCVSIPVGHSFSLRRCSPSQFT